jgi:ABC-type multidrug transport system fused ATPase/permease subunit
VIKNKPDISDIDKILNEKPDKKITRVSIMWTIVLHMLALAIFLSFQVSKTPSVKYQEILLDFTEDDYNVEEKIEEEKISREELIEAMVAQELARDMKNIAVNKAAKKEETSTEKYLKELSQEYDFSNDYQDALDALNSNSDIELSEFRKKIKEKYKSVQFEGPTTIYYELENRTDRYLHIPVYMCESSGKVTLNISVSSEGRVIEATPILSESSSLDECLIKAATNAINKSYFNKVSSPAVQKGKITYIFMPQ